MEEAPHLVIPAITAFIDESNAAASACPESKGSETTMNVSKR